MLTTVIADDGEAELRVGDRFLLIESGEVVSSGIPLDAVSSELVADGPAGDDVRGLEVVHEVVSPPLALLVCGAGADAVPLVRLAVGLGWRVRVVDHRPDYARPGRFPGAAVRLIDRGAEAVETGGGCDAAVVMSHHYERDRLRVRSLLAAGVPYIGVIGPRRRTLRMVRDLGLSATDAARLYAPVGLDIGAETPDEIALAIVAEVQAVRRGGCSATGGVGAWLAVAGGGLPVTAYHGTSFRS